LLGRLQIFAFVQRQLLQQAICKFGLEPHSKRVPLAVVAGVVPELFFVLLHRRLDLNNCKADGALLVPATPVLALVRLRLGLSVEAEFAEERLDLVLAHTVLA